MNPSLQRRGETTRPPIFHDEKERRKKSPRIVVVGVSATRFLRVARAKFTPEDGRFESLTPKNDPSRWTCACRQTESLGGTVLVLRPASGPFVFSSLPPLFSLLLSFESIGCAHVNGNNSFSRTTIFFRNPSLSLSLSVCARVSFSVSANLDKRLVSKCYLPRGDGGEEGGGKGGGGGLLRPFCMERRYGKVRIIDEWGFSNLAPFLSLLFFLPFSREERNGVNFSSSVFCFREGREGGEWFSIG